MKKDETKATKKGYRLKQIADEYGFSLSTLRRLAWSRQIPTVKVAGCVIVLAEDLEKLLAAGYRPASPDVALDGAR